MDLHVFMELTVSSDVANAGSDVWWSLPRRFPGLQRPATASLAQWLSGVITSCGSVAHVACAVRTRQMQCAICGYSVDGRTVFV
jgi:hypothetical protein